MRRDKIKLIRKQLDTKLSRFNPLRDVIPPPKGWIRAIRDALGMTGEQLANRLEVNKQRVARIESDEHKGNLTIKTMERVAEALDCVFVYGFVPRHSLEQTVKNQAERIAQKRVNRVSHTMKLEKQQLNQSEEQASLADTVDSLVSAPPKDFWDE